MEGGRRENLLWVAAVLAVGAAGGLITSTIVASRAEQIATNSGCAIAEVRNARMGVLQITRPHSTEVSDSGLNDSSSIEKDVTAVVSLTFALESR